MQLGLVGLGKMGRNTQERIERGVALPVITAALFDRFRSRDGSPFGDRLLAALRQQFGGHAVKTTAAPGRTNGR